MKLSHRGVFILAAIAWFLIFWNLVEYHEYSHRMTLVMRFMSVAGAIFLAAIGLFGDQENEKKDGK